MSKRYDLAPYADADEIPVYRPRAYEPATETDTGQWSRVVTIANVLLAIILIVGMLWDGKSVVASIVAGAVYYAVTTLGVIALISGQAGVLWQTWQSERTERHRIDAYEYLAERKLELEARPVPQLPADPSQAPDVGETFVPAYPPGAVDEALHWLRGLYGCDGRLDPTRVRSGYVQGSVVGSKRGGGTADARQVLLDCHVLRPAEGGFRLNERAYPTLDRVDALSRRLGGGVGPGPQGYTQG